MEKTEAVLALINKAWEDYDFGDDVYVEAVDSWEPYSVPFKAEEQFTRSFYVANESADSTKMYFSVDIDTKVLAVIGAFANDQLGSEVGTPIDYTVAPQL